MSGRPPGHRRQQVLKLLVRVRGLYDQAPPTVTIGAVLLLGAMLVLACGVAVTELLDEVMDGGRGNQPDDRIVTWVAGRRTGELTSFFLAVTTLADWWFATLVAALAAGTLLVRRQLGLAAAVVAANAGTAAVTAVLKEIVGRDRPPVPGQLIDASGEAFPSGHSSQSVACYGAIALAIVLTSSRPWVRLGAVGASTGIALVVGASRIYLGVHWPSDVISGWIVGFAWLTVVTTLSWTLARIDRPRRWWVRSRSGGPHP